MIEGADGAARTDRPRRLAGGAAKDRLDARQGRQVPGPQREPSDGPLRDDVGALAALDDHARHPHLAWQAAAQSLQVDEQPEERVEGVDPLFGRRDGVRRASVKRDLQRVAGERCGVDAVLGRRMEHQSAVDAAEDPALRHQHLAADRLLGRRADHQDLARSAVERARQDRSRAGSGGADQVVPAGVTHAGEGVVFRQQGDSRPAVAQLPARHERSGQTGDTALDRETLLLEEADEQTRRLGLLQAQLGALVKPAAEPLDRGMETDQLALQARSQRSDHPQARVRRAGRGGSRSR